VENGVDERTAELALVSAKARRAAAEARVQLVQAQIDTAAARVQVAESTAERARQDLAHTRIRAPRAGRVTSASVESGDYVHAGQELLALGPERERSDARLAKAPR
jgi:membrane fusion protein (multidrug efflux system)